MTQQQLLRLMLVFVGVRLAAMHVQMFWNHPYVVVLHLGVGGAIAFFGGAVARWVQPVNHGLELPRREFRALWLATALFALSISACRVITTRYDIQYLSGNVAIGVGVALVCLLGLQLTARRLRSSRARAFVLPSLTAFLFAGSVIRLNDPMLIHRRGVLWFSPEALGGAVVLAFLARWANRRRPAPIPALLPTTRALLLVAVMVLGLNWTVSLAFSYLHPGPPHPSLGGWIVFGGMILFGCYRFGDSWRLPAPVLGRAVKIGFLLIGWHLVLSSLVIPGRFYVESSLGRAGVGVGLIMLFRSSGGDQLIGVALGVRADAEPREFPACVAAGLLLLAGILASQVAGFLGFLAMEFIQAGRFPGFTRERHIDPLVLWFCVVGALVVISGALFRFASRPVRIPDSSD